MMEMTIGVVNQSVVRIPQFRSGLQIYPKMSDVSIIFLLQPNLQNS